MRQNAVRGMCRYRGRCSFGVLYRTGQNEWNICSLEGEIPFHEMMTLDEAKEFDMAQTEAILEDLTVRMINARKTEYPCTGGDKSMGAGASGTEYSGGD